MASITELLTPQDIQTIGSLEIVARLVVEGFCSGLHRSPHKGFSVEFRQHRSYVPGDEIRHIDWKVFGKTDRFYIREYEEETNLRATLLLDKSGSMAYGSGKVTKFDYAVRLAACLAHLMLRQADGVGLVTFDSEMDKYIPPRSRPGHLRVLLDTLEQCQPGNETELGKVFHDLVPKIQRRGLLIIISDCFGEEAGAEEALAFHGDDARAVGPAADRGGDGRVGRGPSGPVRDSRRIAGDGRGAREVGGGRHAGQDRPLDRTGRGRPDYRGALSTEAGRGGDAVGEVVDS